MIRLLRRIALTLVVGACFAGCVSVSKQALPAISSLGPDPRGVEVDDRWSEPVNGVRMKLMQVVSSSDNKPRITLLIFAHNVSDRPVQWHAVKPECRVVHEPDQYIEKNTNANLRIFASPVNGLIQINVAPQQAQRQAQRATQPYLQPGQVVVYAIDATGDRMAPLDRGRADHDTLHAQSIGWAGLNDPSGQGPWTVRAVYKPDGFDQVDQAVLKSEWNGKQIDLPETTMYLSPSLYGLPEQINELRSESR